MITPDTDQRVCVNSIQGAYVVVAGPGSGKSSTLVHRYLEMISKHRIPPSDILNLTFTSEAAKNMVEKVGLVGAEKVFRTFHSFALDLIMREKQHLPFKVGEFVLPSYGQDFQLLKDLMKLYPAITSFRSLREKLAEWKASNISPKQAIEDTYLDTKKNLFFYAAAYRDYEKKSREQGWLDFSSLMDETVKLLETNDEVRSRYVRKYICVDECQDTDSIQFKLLKLIYGGNIFVVGDENQCQPPGTIVDVLVSPRKGRIGSQIERVNIEDLSETNDKLVSWDHRAKRLRFGCGRRFRRATRQFDGTLLEIHSNGKKTKVTPNHFVWVKFNRQALKKKTHFVYLMWRKDLGYRVGTSTLRMACGSNQISHRGYQEQAEKMWILDVVDSGKEARTREEIYSLKYQIPERIFQDRDAARVFKSVSQYGGLKLLQEKGLVFDYPLVFWNKKNKHLTKFHGYFKTVAANVLEGLMDVPTKTNFKSAIVAKVKKVEYRGPVYSLEVEKDHTYIADGIPVGNCIYEWRSAVIGSLSNFATYFSGATTLFLGNNYRSTGAIVAFLKKIIPVDNGLASHMVSMREWGVDPTFTQYDDELQEVVHILYQINEAKDFNNTAVIARTNRQLRTFQKAAMALGIKTMILGQKDLWQKDEVKHLIDLTKKFKDSGRKAYDVMEEQMRQHNLTHIYRNAGGPNEKPPVENLADIVKLSANRGTVKEFLDWLRKLTYACEAAKSPSYEHRDKNPTLTLTTVHQAKGREYKNVFVIGCKQGMMPHKEGEILEEKRIFFVACSRAADRLHISYDGNRSEFLNDFQEEIKHHEQKHTEQQDPTPVRSTTGKASGATLLDSI